jgi:hypothetical protein
MIVITRPPEFADHLREFRSERIRTIQEGEVPAKLAERARLVVHIVPSRAFDETAEMDFAPFTLETDFLKPMHAWGYDAIRHNFDGLLRVARDDDTVYSYVQLFRNGVIEAVNTSLLRKDGDRQPSVPGTEVEHEAMELIVKSLPHLKELKVEAPVYVMLSLLGVKGYTMESRGFSTFTRRQSIDRDDLIIREVKLESFDVDVGDLMRPAFNRLWNAGGRSRSPSYDENDKRKK